MFELLGGNLVPLECGSFQGLRLDEVEVIRLDSSKYPRYTACDPRALSTWGVGEACTSRDAIYFMYRKPFPIDIQVWSVPSLSL